MQTELVLNQEQLEKWFKDRHSWDPFFGFQFNEINIPSLIIWEDEESNGYPKVKYETFTKADLQQILQEMSKPFDIPITP